LPPASNERYKFEEKLAPHPIDSSLVISQKPSPEALKPATRGVETKQDEPAPRRSFADITARPEFAHDANYKWVVGELSYVPQKKTWRVRYTSIDDEDRYGGSVTLDASHMMEGYKTGQLVRVEGALLDAESHEPAPGYRVNNIEVYASKEK
jgi:hypothetical protein